ncbi:MULTISPECIES: NAD(P)H-dependent glycerol-3-phosphate dehydrogenase [Caproicibacterium]|uniref:Glycerol-3-phosphate dehydrogenase n=1 Tax=Caproicibacterium argilliputei TaxID=3030016 RepID=A0AA97H061_9FIRM|nr:NAD(P)H-dependent glycerol-3-phosphate dehydrogenase [Caproicibacterium argilliputei]WOC31231.1 NAD(P)H-dependent glycerol-3-phosphate dehydrogenase [Caproicibacterium argilliputei]
MNVTVCGCGRWGSFLAWYTAEKCGHAVTLYGRESSARFQQLAQTRSNGMLTFPESVRFSSDLHAAVQSAQTVVISIGAQNLRSFLQELSEAECAGKTFVLCMKGIEASTGLRLTQVVRTFLPNIDLAVWVGPGHVQDFQQGIPNCMVIDSDSDAVKRRVVKIFESPLIRFYFGNDLLGNEVGAAAKNVIGIAAGMLDGLNKTALKGALMSRGTREVGRLIKAMGGQEITAYGLAHLGDYEATVFSRYSHNRQFGEDFVRGVPYDKLAEGVPTVTALLELGERCKVDLPICKAVDAVINGGQEPNQVLGSLFLRSIKREF